MSLILKKGTDVVRQTLLLEDGRPFWTTDTKRLFIGDGITLGGNPTSLVSGVSGVTQETLTNLTIQPNQAIEFPHVLGVKPKQVSAYKTSALSEISLDASNMSLSNSTYANKKLTSEKTESNAIKNLTYDLCNTVNVKPVFMATPNSSSTTYFSNPVLSESDSTKVTNPLNTYNMPADAQYRGAYELPEKQIMMISSFAIVSGQNITNAFPELMLFDITNRSVLYQYNLGEIFGDRGVICYYIQGATSASVRGRLTIIGDYDEDTGIGLIARNDSLGTVFAEFNFYTGKLIEYINNPLVSNRIITSINYINDRIFITLKDADYSIYEYKPNKELVFITGFMGAGTYNMLTRIYGFDDGSYLISIDQNIRYMDVAGDVHLVSSGVGTMGAKAIAIDWNGRKYMSITFQDGWYYLYHIVNDSTYNLLHSEQLQVRQHYISVLQTWAENTGELYIELFYFGGTNGATVDKTQRVVIDATGISASGVGVKNIFTADSGTALEVDIPCIIASLSPTFSTSAGTGTKNILVKVDSWDEITDVQTVASDSGETLDIKFLANDGASDLPSPYDGILACDSTLYDNIKGIDAVGKYELTGGSGTWNLEIDGDSIMSGDITFDTDLNLTAQKIVANINANSKTSDYNNQVYAEITNGVSEITITVPNYAGIAADLNTTNIVNGGTGTGTQTPFSGAKESLLNVVKSQAGIKGFSYQIQLQTSDVDITPVFKELKLIVSEIAYDKLIDKNDNIDIYVNDTNVKIKNNSSKNITMNLELIT